MRYRVAVVAAYLALMTLWVYGVVDRTEADRTAWLLPALILLQIAAGLVIGRWWAMVLPLLLVPISVPAGNPPITPDNAEPFPVFFGVGVAAVFAIPLVALGLVARIAYEWRAGSPVLK